MKCPYYVIHCTLSNKNMQAERVLFEIRTLRKKYSQAIFDKNILCEKQKKNEEAILKSEEDKEFVSTQLKEALEKINFLESENVKIREENVKLREKCIKTNNTSKQTNDVSDKKTPQELRQLKSQNNVLMARLKQAERGMKQKETFKRENLNSSSEDFEVEKIMDHQLGRRQNSYLIRWKGFGPDSDTWQPENSLTNCNKMLENYKQHHKL